MSASQEKTMNATKSSEHRAHILPPLPYPQNALEPHISARTVELHYERHHVGYLRKLNALVAGTAQAGWSLEDLVCKAEGTLFNQAAQVFNHSFYWDSLSPDTGLKPDADLEQALTASFGSKEKMLDTFRESALAKFGSGWTWLVVDDTGALRIENSDDASCPLRHGRTPLLTCDVWEHAYYLDYQNERSRYVEAFLPLLDWDRASRRYATANRSKRHGS
jgi:Fe-Mn family superoxide dismutase